ncbi:MAG: 2-aminoethylphosphonate ABC transporter substrate-binding protein [Gammaproteobacteria bacterium]|nr:2-aminoethylphosphonate ABC transporter substrate-binding protein [Gammaproteobacteria bacterium]
MTAARTIRARLVIALLLCGLAAAAGSRAAVVTVYSADGLRDGRPNWFGTMFAAFERRTGITVQYVEAGSGVIVNRMLAERAAPQADVLVTIPPFMQVAADAGALRPLILAPADSAALGAPHAPALWYPLADDYSAWIYDAAALPAPPASLAALLAPTFRNRLQYSTPGQAGDGTAVLLQAFEAFGSQRAGLAYLRRLQANNLGPSASTGRLAALVDKGEIWVANGDVQMSYSQQREYPNLRLFFPAGPDGRRLAVRLPYQIALVRGAPHEHAALQLIAFLLSRPAQARLYDLARAFPARHDVPPTTPAAHALEHVIDGVRIWQPDWTRVAKRLGHDVALWRQATER